MRAESPDDSSDGARDCSSDTNEPIVQKGGAGVKRDSRPRLFSAQTAVSFTLGANSGTGDVTFVGRQPAVSLTDPRPALRIRDKSHSFSPNFKGAASNVRPDDSSPARLAPAAPEKARELLLPRKVSRPMRRSMRELRGEHRATEAGSKAGGRRTMVSDPSRSILGSLEGSAAAIEDAGLGAPNTPDLAVSDAPALAAARSRGLRSPLGQSKRAIFAGSGGSSPGGVATPVGGGQGLGEQRSDQL
jgi:hypothetical protein